MDYTAIELCEKIQCARVAYIQSDEISIVISKPRVKSQIWFDGNHSKIVSVSAFQQKKKFQII
jgi:tRNA(His) 5'-end guanylyltransferase